MLCEEARLPSLSSERRSFPAFPPRDSLVSSSLPNDPSHQRCNRSSRLLSLHYSQSDIYTIYLIVRWQSIIHRQLNQEYTSRRKAWRCSLLFKVVPCSDSFLALTSCWKYTPPTSFLWLRQGRMFRKNDPKIPPLNAVSINPIESLEHDDVYRK